MLTQGASQRDFHLQSFTPKSFLTILPLVQQQPSGV